MIDRHFPNQGWLRLRRDTIGELRAFAAAEAIIDTTVRLVKRSSLEQAAGVDVQVARKLWSMTAGELRHAEDHMLLLGRKNAMERVAEKAPDRVVVHVGADDAHRAFAVFVQGADQTSAAGRSRGREENRRHERSIRSFAR